MYGKVSSRPGTPGIAVYNAEKIITYPWRLPGSREEILTLSEVFVSIRAEHLNTCLVIARVSILHTWLR
jgi:hypothetical protein